VCVCINIYSWGAVSGFDLQLLRRMLVCVYVCVCALTRLVCVCVHGVCFGQALTSNSSGTCSKSCHPSFSPLTASCLLHILPHTTVALPADVISGEAASQPKTRDFDGQASDKEGPVEEVSRMSSACILRIDILARKVRYFSTCTARAAEAEAHRLQQNKHISVVELGPRGRVIPGMAGRVSICAFVPAA
jgi:hypothetical protein